MGEKMKYLEAKWIINEVESLIEEYESKSTVRMENYYDIIPDGIYPTTLNRMTLDEVADIINSHYGVYKEDDVVTDKLGIPCLITHIDYSNAETLHEVKYHVLYQGGITSVLYIDDIVAKLGSVYDAIGEVNKILGDYFDDEMERITKESNGQN